MNLGKIFLICLVIILVCGLSASDAQNVQRVYQPNIQTVQLYEYGNQQGLPIYTLNSDNKMFLSFDDMDGNYKNYYYSFVLCDYNWQPANLSEFDYIKGFIQNRITTYRYSNIAYTKYTHYQVSLPESNSMPTKSGNYLLKVFLDGDTSKLVFTKQFLVLEQRTIINALVVQPLSSMLYNTHQKLRFNANVKELNAFSPAQEIKTVILQNNRWDNAKRDIVPGFVRGNILEFNNENTAVFPGGREWRWLDLRSFRMENDPIDKIVYNQNESNIYLKTDVDRHNQRYAYYTDYNGSYNIDTYESINPFWQSDYTTVHFSLEPTENLFLKGVEVYLAGQFTNFELNEKWKMNFNPNSGKFETSAFLKQGYYNYTYIIVDRNDENNNTDLEGDHWETENTYTILMYYKSFSDRNDRLIGACKINSRTDKPGYSF